MSPEPRGDAVRAVLVACLVLSGAASLMDQVVWLRELALVFGNTTLAAATLLAVFMGGLGLGALLVGRFAERLTHPLRLYALFEVGIGLVALASPAMFGLLDGAYVALYRAWGNEPGLFAAARAVLAALVLLPPTLLMGGTLPLALRGVARQDGRPGRDSALFYGANTVGAVAGTALAGFVTVRTLGLQGTLVVAATANMAAALGALALAAPRPALPPPARRAPGRRPLLVLFFLMGATSLAFEVVWTRILVFYVGSSVYAYSLMLLLVLLGIGLGSLLATRWADRLSRPLLALALVEAAIAAWTPLQLLLFGRLNDLLLAAAEALAPRGFSGVAVAQLLALAPLLLPPTLLMGLSFPLAVRVFNREAERVAGDVGAIYGVNTLGAVAGALAAGFLLVPLAGTQGALLLTAAANAALAAWLGARCERRAPAWAAAGAAALGLGVAALLVPPGHAILAAGMFRGDAPGSLLYFHEDAQASVTVRRLPGAAGDYLSLELNGVNVAGTSPDLDAIQRLQGHLPLLLLPRLGPVAHIGFGSGGTAWAVSRHPVPDILIVEISPEVLAASDRFFPDINHGVLRDPRVRTELNDGRNFLLATPERFAAVLSDSIHPRYAGNSTLYTSEYFDLLAERLEPDGVASMWLPMYSLTPRNFGMILRAFRDAFPVMEVWYEASTLNSFTIVTGRRRGPVWSDERLAAAFADPRVAGELRGVGIARPADLLPLLLGTGETLAPWLDRLPPHEDDLPAVEYESGALLVRDEPWLMTFGHLLSLRPSEPPAAFVAALPPGERAAAVGAYRERAGLLARHRQSLATQIGQRWQALRSAAAR